MPWFVGTTKRLRIKLINDTKIEYNVEQCYLFSDGKYIECSDSAYNTICPQQLVFHQKITI